jgi:hypothetical protein
MPLNRNEMVARLQSFHQGGCGYRVDPIDTCDAFFASLLTGIARIAGSK